MGMDRRLCPDLNYTFAIFGKQTSAIWEYLEIRISKCDAAASTIPCATQTYIDSVIAQRGELDAVLFYVNPLINPGSTVYLDYFVEDRNFISFTMTQGAYSTANIQDYEIDTD